jgi:NTP pyrophosphatase (non-canonical NTP hydrolase)
MNLENVILELKQFVKERDWSKFHSPKNLAMAIVSEAGELAALYRFVKDDDSDSFSNINKPREKIANEIADVGIFILLLCDRIGIDLIEAIKNKIKINRQNYPADKIRGQAERPTNDKSF